MVGWGGYGSASPFSHEPVERVTINANLGRLIDANAPLWAGEAEVFRGYWDWDMRSRESDLLWLSRQCQKEFWGGVALSLDQLNANFDEIDRGIDRHQALELAARVHQEFAHYCAFADAYDALRGEDEPALDLQALEERGNWPENRELARLRARHKERHGELGARAHSFTEGGYCTLYSEGMKLKGRGGVDDLIAEACAKVHDDEFEHMLQGIAGLDEAGWSAADWQLFTDLTVEQMGHRIAMRNAQFSHPLPEQRVARILAGEIEPLPFDYQRAGLSQA